MRSDELAAEEWAAAWRSLKQGTEVQIDWEDRVWRNIGRQRVPVRVRFTHPDAVARFVGGAGARDWSLLRSRASIVRNVFGATEAASAAIRRHIEPLLRVSDDEFMTVVTAGSWLIDHPVRAAPPAATADPRR